MQLIKKLCLYSFYGLLAYMPFHVFLATWLGTSFDVLDPAKAVKDVVLLVGFTALFLMAGKKVQLELLKNKLTWLIAAYAVLTVGFMLVKSNDQDAEIIAVVNNLRFLLFFLYGVLIIKLFGKDILKTALKIVVYAGVVTALLGILQVTVLPNDALERVGYSRANGTPPVFYISDKEESFERAYATVKDPNSFGSYLIVILCLTLALLYKKRREKDQTKLLIGLGIIGICLFLTYSRSAWVGAAVAVMAFVALHDGVQAYVLRHKKRVGLLLAAGVVTLAAGLAIFRDTSLVQNLVFHVGDDAATTSNSQRLGAIDGALTRISDNPLGYGPGSAGPASLKNNTQGALVPENYYLQIGLEVGVIGLLIFLAICFVVAKELFKHKKDPIALGLLASFIGLAVSNMLVHIWFNEAVAFTWWGLAGVYLANYLYHQPKDS